MTSHIAELLALAIAWLAYGTLHSLLASLRCKAWFRARWPQQMHGYRIAFNVSAVALLVPVLVFERSLDAIPLWAWAGSAKIIALSLMAVAILCFIWSTRYYDMPHFIGTRQWHRKKSTNDDEGTFTISPLHRFVRHPWYSLALVILWTRDIESSTLLSNLMISGYFIIGAKLEENKLIAQFGDRYREYQRRVPGIVPQPWCYLSAQEASELSAHSKYID